MGRANRESRKIVLDNIHAGSVSKAIWPINTRTTTSIARYKSMPSKRRHLLSFSGTAFSSSPQRSTHKRTSIPQLEASPNPTVPFRMRIAFSLCVAGSTLLLGLFYSWTILLILSLICATITLIMIHLFFDEETPTCRGIEHTHMPSAIPIPYVTPPPLEGTRPIQHHQPDGTTPFPTTPMPPSPVIRVLETIDLSSTNVEHFLDT